MSDESNSQEYVCSQCRTPIKYGDKICKGCGAPLEWEASEDTREVHKTLGTKGELKWITKAYGWWKVLTVIIPFAGIIVGCIGARSYDERTKHYSILLRRLGIVILLSWIAMIAYSAYHYVTMLQALK